VNFKEVIDMQSIPIASIRIENRLRSLDSAKVAELAASIAEIGLLQPIGIRPDGTLVYGYHRLEACKQLGWTEIPAVVVDGDDSHAELAEISENLIRNELTLLERAEHLARMRAVYERLYPNARGVGRPAKNSATVAAFSEWAAAQAGLAQRTIRHYVQLAESLAPEVRDAIRRTPIANDGAELKSLASLEPSKQRAVAELIASRAVSSVREATRELTRREALHRESAGELPTGIAIRHGDFREVLGDLRGQVDTMITDPPYLSEYIPLYGELAKLAAELLRPHGVLVVMTPHLHLPEVVNCMTPHLRYRWICTYYMGDTKANVSAAKIATSWKPLLMFTRNDAENLRFVCSDYFSAAHNTADGVQKELHHWQQSLDGFIQIVERFTEPGELVVDPFLGSGTTAVACLRLGRQFVGCDTDAGAVAIARRRVQHAIEGGELS
jgi:ParB family chromosome partitioning protein